ncbi:SDR family NAD(P)-dependent oxidoreductase [Candidatus Omnitrophota bacterium]
MIVLTGASGGVGKELVKHLSKIDNVVGIYNKSLPKDKSNSKVTYEKVDIEDVEAIKSFAQKWKGKLSHLTLVHSAVFNIDGLVANYKESDWDKMMNINLKGNLFLTQALIPQMIQEKWGRIIHISSVVGMEGRVGTVAYSASKTALLGTSRVLAQEYGRFNITSNILTLGYFEVGLIETLDKDAKKELLNRIPSKSLGKVSDIASAIEFLIKSEYVNGSVVTIDGAFQ